LTSAESRPMPTEHDSKAPLACVGLRKCFSEGPAVLEVLKGCNFAVQPGETLAIVGASGCGKTTLLQLLGGLDQPTAGQVLVFGQDLSELNETARGRLRNQTLGFVYQFHHLLPEFTAVENVAMPLLIRRESISDIRDHAVRLLERVGLGARLEHRPGELSGGERQRVAVARALATGPAVVLADEPTGNLDEAASERVLDLMLELNAETGASLVLVTHERRIAQRMSRVLTLSDGLLTDVSDRYRD